MDYKIPEKLVIQIKKILRDEPLDIYFSSTDSYSTSITELVESRESESGKMVGSANMIIASALLNFELMESEIQEEDYSDTFSGIWAELLESLKIEGFLKDTPEAAREGIYLAVDNETPYKGLKQHSCLNKGEITNECNFE